MKNPVQFVNEVRAEARKVVWPTRKEAGVTTAMVFVMATIIAIFFFFVDRLIALGVDVLLNI